VTKINEYSFQNIQRQLTLTKKAAIFQRRHGNTAVTVTPG